MKEFDDYKGSVFCNGVLLLIPLSGSLTISYDLVLKEIKMNEYYDDVLHDWIYSKMKYPNEEFRMKVKHGLVKSMKGTIKCQ